MSLLRGFARFWYDFVIGDDWKIAAAIAVTVAIGALLAANSARGAEWIPPVMGVALAAAFVVSLVVDVRRGWRRLRR